MIHARWRQHRCVRGILPFIVLAGASGVAGAQQSPALSRLDLSLGGYYASVGTTIGASTINDEYHGKVNLEDVLGFRRRNSVPRARLDLLIGDSQGFSFNYFSVSRSHRKTLKQRISYDGNNCDAMASVRDKLDFDFGSASYRWWFGPGNDVFGLGGAWYRVQASISGEASVNGGFMGETSASTSAQAWAPELQWAGATPSPTSGGCMPMGPG